LNAIRDVERVNNRIEFAPLVVHIILYASDGVAGTSALETPFPLHIRYAIS